jgi:hypothetical protein
MVEIIGCVREVEVRVQYSVLHSTNCILLSSRVVVASKTILRFQRTTDIKVTTYAGISSGCYLKPDAFS